MPSVDLARAWQSAMDVAVRWQSGWGCALKAFGYLGMLLIPLSALWTSWGELGVKLQTILVIAWIASTAIAMLTGVVAVYEKQRLLDSYLDESRVDAEMPHSMRQRLREIVKESGATLQWLSVPGKAVGLSQALAAVQRTRELGMAASPHDRIVALSADLFSVVHDAALEIEESPGNDDGTDNVAAFNSTAETAAARAKPIAKELRRVCQETLRAYPVPRRVPDPQSTESKS